MASLGSVFDANSVAPAEARDIIPPGKYLAQIVQSEMRPTKNGDGQYLNLELDILEGQFQGRKVWDLLNLENPNAQAVEIAQRTLSAICHATGQMHVSDSDVLHFKPMLITIAVVPPKGEYAAKNKVSGYAAANAGSAGHAQAKPGPAYAAPARQAAPSRPAPATGPWAARRAG